jgi:acyl-coenzyme A thioesterase PaaI-like protein
MTGDPPAGGPVDPTGVADEVPSLFERGHPAADLLESWSWPVLSRGPDHLHLRAGLPERVRNRRGQLFGGFTATYVDLLASATLHGSRPAGERFWLATTSMRLEYLAPVLGPSFVIEGRLVTTRGRTAVVETRFLDDDGQITVHAVATFRVLPVG